MRYRMGCTPTRERLVDRLIKRQIFIDEQIDKLAQMLIRRFSTALTYWFRYQAQHTLAYEVQAISPGRWLKLPQLIV
jgi:hypothetical protein